MRGLRLACVTLLSLFAATTTTVDPIRFEESPAPQFVTRTGRTARRYLPQTMGGGVAVFDYNNDGLLDIYVVNGTTMPALVKDGPQYSDRLFRFESVEGSSRSRNAVIEFPTYQAAVDCWHAPEYQKVMKLRTPVSTADLVIIEGYDGPQPAAK